MEIRGKAKEKLKVLWRLQLDFASAAIFKHCNINAFKQEGISRDKKSNCYQVDFVFWPRSLNSILIKNKNGKKDSECFVSSIYNIMTTCKIFFHFLQSKKIAFFRYFAYLAETCAR